MSAEVALKVYGERNTGTNYLEQLASENLSVRILSGIVPRRYWQTFLTRQLRAVAPERFAGTHESARDRYFTRTFASTLGWKHMIPAPEAIGQNNLAEVRFVMLVKNPYSWLLSLYRRPYHGGAKSVSMEAFLDRKYPVMEGRENLGSDALPPVEIWNRKTAAYLSLQAQAAHGLIVRYEDFLSDEKGTLERLAEDLEIKWSADYRPKSEASKKRDASTHGDYVDYYLNEKWRTNLTPQTVKKINESLDQELLARLGYDAIDPEAL